MLYNVLSIDFKNGSFFYFKTVIVLKVKIEFFLKLFIIFKICKSLVNKVDLKINL